MTIKPDRDPRDVLLEATGMVTELLEVLSGEPIDAERMFHETVAVGADNIFNLGKSSAVLHRAALLRGRVTRTPYLYAESFIACDRLPEAICTQLQHTNVPLGRTLAEHGLGFERMMFGEPRCRPMSSDEQLLGLIRSAGAQRSYWIVIDGEPAIAIDEWFLPAAVGSRPLRGD